MPASRQRGQTFGLQFDLIFALGFRAQFSAASLAKTLAHVFHVALAVDCAARIGIPWQELDEAFLPGLVLYGIDFTGQDDWHSGF